MPLKETDLILNHTLAMGYEVSYQKESIRTSQNVSEDKINLV